jgi:ferredoxin
MPLVTFLDDDLTEDVPAGTKMATAAENAGASLLFGCRSGNCGKCRVRVKHGAENLSEVGEREFSFLKLIDAKPNERLACQVRVNGDCAIEQA